MESKITSAHSAHATYLKEQLRQTQVDLGGQIGLNRVLREKNEKLSQRLRHKQLSSFLWGALFSWCVSMAIFVTVGWPQ